MKFNKNNKIFFIILLVVALGLIAFLIYKFVKWFLNRDSFEDNEEDNEEYNTEVHFISLWTKDYEKYLKILKNEINNYNKNENDFSKKIRILKEIEVEKNNIEKLFVNVDSGGKHNKNNIYIIILEVPKIYSIKKTYSNKNGENVNKIMYNLKIKIRGNYENYKIAHGSFNKKEANQFFKEYFKYYDNFENIEQLFYILNKFNIFWIYDRIDFTFDKDIDLVVDSIPAANFILKNINLSHKVYKFINNKKTLIDLRDFDSNYYPKKWLLDLKNSSKYTIKNNIRTPESLNWYMLSLYHKFIHKNNIQTDSRNNIIKKYSNNLNIKDTFLNLLAFLKSNDYQIEKPNDKNVGFFIEFKSAGGNNKKVFLYNNLYYYIYNKKEIFNKEKTIYTKLEKYNITPKILNINDKNFILELENCGKPIIELKSNIKDFKYQINNIKNILKKEKIIHNDIHNHNILFNNNLKLYLIDFEYSLINDMKDYREPEIYYCKNLPDIKNEKNIFEYFKNNDCLKKK